MIGCAHSTASAIAVIVAGTRAEPGSYWAELSRCQNCICDQNDAFTPFVHQGRLHASPFVRQSIFGGDSKPWSGTRWICLLKWQGLNRAASDWTERCPSESTSPSHLGQNGCAVHPSLCPVLQTVLQERADYHSRMRFHPTRRTPTGSQFRGQAQFVILFLGASNRDWSSRYSPISHSEPRAYSATIGVSICDLNVSWTGRRTAFPALKPQAGRTAKPRKSSYDSLENKN